MTIQDYIKYQAKEKEELTGYSFPEDIIRIKKVMRDRGIDLTTAEADEIWSVHSDNYCAIWLGLPSDDNELFDIIIETAKEIYR